jgi:hypothetical protein
VIPTTGIRKGETRTVNALASYLVADHINTLLAESAANRQAKLAKRSDRANPLVSALNAVRSLLAAPTDRPLALPKLTDYPYRS